MQVCERTVLREQAPSEDMTASTSRRDGDREQDEDPQPKVGGQSSRVRGPELLGRLSLHLAQAWLSALSSPTLWTRSGGEDPGCARREASRMAFQVEEGGLPFWLWDNIDWR